jgi:hypothetical protein
MPDINERRSQHYTFEKQKRLVNFFSGWMDKKKIRNIIQNAQNSFVIRDGASDEDTRLQFLKKCEYSLLKQMKYKQERFGSVS